MFHHSRWVNRMDKQLTESSRKYSNDSVRFGTYEWHVASDKVTWSENVLAILGRETPPVAETGFLPIVHPDDRHSVEAVVAATLEGQDSYDHEYRAQRPDGTIAVLQDIGKVHRDSSGRAVKFSGLIVDITDHRPDFEEKFSGAAISGVAQYDFDVATGIAKWSDAACALFAVPISPFINPAQIVFKRIHPENLTDIQTRFDQVLRTVDTFEIEYPFLLEDGTERWILDRGCTVGPLNPQTHRVRRVRGVMTDITALKRRETELRDVANGFHTLVDRSLAGTYVLDADLQFVELNDTAEEVMGGFGVRIGADFVAVTRAQWPRAIADEIISHFRHTLKTGESYTAPPLIGERADRGRVEAYDWRIDRIERPDGRFGVVCYFYDLTVREQQAEELRRLADRLDLAYRAAGMGAWEFDLRSGEVFWSPQIYELFGLDPSVTITTELISGLIHPDESATQFETFFETVKTSEEYDAEFPILRPDGTLRFIALRGRVTSRDDSGALRVIGVAYDTTERRRIERDLRKSERNLRTILDRSLAFVGLLDPDGVLREANRPALNAGGLSRDSAIGHPFWKTPWFAYDDAVATRLEKAVARARTGENVRYDEVVRMRGDTRMTIDLMLAPVVENGETVRLVASGFDVSDREAARAHAGVLMKEINHRSKNLLTLVDVIARQSQRGDPQGFLDRFQGRIRALARAQDLLVQDEQDGLWLEALMRSQLAHFDDDTFGQIALDGPSVYLDAQTAQSVGMALHELATNAGKYGALSVPEGRIDLTWTIDREGLLVLDWIETGGPSIEGPARKGFGSFVTRELLEQSLDAKVHVEYRPEGVHWRAVLTRGFNSKPA